MPKFLSFRSIVRPRQHGWPCTVAVLALASFALLTSPASAITSVQPAYETLVRRIEAADGRNADRHAIVSAAHDLQDAIRADGGARGRLMIAIHNIVASLRNGSFNAGASLQTLRAIAPHAVVQKATWHPEAVYSSPVGLDLHQRGEGDCVGISVLKAFSTTKVGESILRRAVARDPAGGFVVTLPGAPSRVFHVPDQDLNQYGIGDPAAAAIIGALFRYFDLDPHHAALPTNKVMELLAGDLGQHARLADHRSSAPAIEHYLVRHASAVGTTVAMVFGGKPSHGGDWSRGDGHAFAVLRIDAPSRTVFYTNPWNESRVHTIAISDLAAQASGSGADFETIRF